MPDGLQGRVGLACGDEPGRAARAAPRLAAPDALVARRCRARCGSLLSSRRRPEPGTHRAPPSLLPLPAGGALAVPSAPQAVWLLGPAAMALLGGAHIDYRHRRGEGGTLSAETERVTSLLPFAAMAAGAQAEGALGSLQALARELKVENAVLGVLLAARWAVTRGR